MRILIAMLIIAVGCGLIAKPFYEREILRINGVKAAIEYEKNPDVNQTVPIQAEQQPDVPAADPAAQGDDQTTEGQPATTSANDLTKTSGGIKSNEAYILGRLIIPSINVNMVVLEGASPEKLNINLGQLAFTKKIGSVGNALIAGHRSYTKNVQFNALGELKNGEWVEFQEKVGNNKSKSYFFRVTSTAVVEQDDTMYYDDIDSSRRTLTLLTCHPLLDSTYRLVKICDLVMVIDENDEKIPSQELPEKSAPTIATTTIQEMANMEPKLIAQKN